VPVQEDFQQLIFWLVKGHSVEIFEASPNPGGMLRYGIPPYRLPNEVIDAEVKSIEALGVKFTTTQNLERTSPIKNLNRTLMQ
jgi:NADPH-dependent glutamate synthase beta subunit-like oxidoreductase